MTNSFLHPTDQVHFDTYRPEDAHNAVDTAIARAKERVQRLKSIKTPAFEDTVLGLTRCDEELEFVVNIISHLEAMHMSTWAKAKEYAVQKYVKFSSEIAFDKKIYRQLLLVRSNSGNLRAHEMRLLDKLIRDYEDSGIALPAEQQKRLKWIAQRNAKLRDKFSQNLVTERKIRPLKVSAESDLQGIRPDVIASFKKAADKAKIPGFLIANNDGNFETIMMNCSVASTRASMHRLYTTAAAKKNHKILHEILSLRFEQAQILGYETPAHMYMRERMAKEPARALLFVEDLITRYYEKSKQEYRTLLGFVQDSYSPQLKELPQLDFDSGLDLYYSIKYFSKLHNLDLDATKDYFEFGSTRDYMFSVLSKLYGVSFTRARKASWHKDVEVYLIHDDEGNLLAEAHCDWFSRDDKHGHAWMNTFVAADETSAPATHHIGCVIMNIAPGTDSTPALMTLNSVETLWHEFGHFMHLALNKTKLREQSIDHVKWDFVEAPSQIMENWVLHDEILPHYAKHYKTGEPLPAESVESLKHMATFNVGIKAIRQLYYSYLDLKIHTTERFDTPEEMATYAKELRAKYLPVEPMGYYAPLSSFGHLIGGYQAGYYSYKWAESLQADMFSRFEKEGVLSPIVGAELRNKVLSRGDEVDPDVLIEDFLGRAANPDAMLRRDGVL